MSTPDSRLCAGDRFAVLAMTALQALPTVLCALAFPPEDEPWEPDLVIARDPHLCAGDPSLRSR